MDTERIEEIEGQLEVMKAYLEGKAIQYRFKDDDDDNWEWEDVDNPTWNWNVFDYRVKPDETKKLMTDSQLSELLQKGYGIWSDKGALGYAHADYVFSFNKEDVAVINTLIRPWGSDEWLEPTVDIYEEYVSKWNKAFEMGKTEKTTSEESSATVSKEETVGVHRRTPQEIADFFGCYMAMDSDGTWYLYEKEPFLEEGESDWSVDPKSNVRCIGYSDFFIVEQKPSNWRTLYRPHQEPVVMEEDDD